MKNSIPFTNFSQFIVRSPLFPANVAIDLFSANDTESIKEICKNKHIKEAIYLASPNLYSEMQKWLDNELTDKKKTERLQHSILKYLIRMSIRCTPFGMFAGFNTGSFDDKTEILIKDKSCSKMHTRLDMNYLCALAKDLTKIDTIRNNTKFYPNSSMYVLGDTLRYVEYRYINSRRVHHIVSVDHSEYLELIISKAKKGVYIHELKMMLTDDEISDDEAMEFINELIGSQILINELEPSATGPEFLDQMINILDSVKENTEINENLSKLKNTLNSFHNEKSENPISKYRNLENELKSLNTDYDIKYLFQTDLLKEAEVCKLNKTIAEDVLEAINVLMKLNRQPSKTNLTVFREKFYERYEDKEIPLLEVLDTESGIGYSQGRSAVSNPLVENIRLGQTQTKREIIWDSVESFKLKKFIKAVSEDKYEVEIIDEELKAFEADWNSLPDTFSSMICVLEEIDKDEGKYRILLNSAGGSGAANLLGRFCHADELTHDHVKEIIKKEEELNDNAIYAEITHLPESRTGNILLRPALRKHEIPYLAKSAVKDQDEINMDDLMISVNLNRIILRSKKHNKEVVPRLSTAHNYSYNALPVYQFLCDMQLQNKIGGLGFNWGKLSGEFDFHPRLVYKNIILSPASWNVQVKDISEIIKIKNDDELLEAIKQWRHNNKMPEKVLLADSDNELLINLSSIISVKTFFSLINKRRSFSLNEFLFEEDKAIVKSSEGDFTNEFVLSFYRKEGENQK